jgi:hypothetical protein
VSLDQLERVLGIPAGHEDRLHAADAGDGDRVLEAGDVGQRRWHQHDIVGGEPVHLDHERRLRGQARVGVQRPLRLTARPRGVQHQGEVFGGGAPGAHRLARVDQGGHVVGVHHEVRAEPGQQRVDLGRSGEVVDRGGDGAEPPAGPVQREGLPPVGGLPGDGAPVARALRSQRAGQPRDRALQRVRAEVDRVVDDGGAGRTQRLVERRSLGGPVLVEPGGLQPHVLRPHPPP